MTNSITIERGIGMKDYIIVTESTSDLPQDLVDELDIKVIPMTFGFENESYLNYPDNRELDIHIFYDSTTENFPMDVRRLRRIRTSFLH